MFVKLSYNYIIIIMVNKNFDNFSRSEFTEYFVFTYCACLKQACNNNNNKYKN